METNEIEDLESLRHRIRNEARQRREQQFLIRQRARALPAVAVNRSPLTYGGSNGDSSRSSSPDLLASPPPTQPAAHCDVTVAEKMKQPDDIKDAKISVESKKLACHGNTTSAEVLIKDKPKQARTSKSKRKFYQSSSSSSSEDEEEIARRIARNVAKKSKAEKVKMSQKNNEAKLAIESYSDSSDDFLTRRAAKKKSESIQKISGDEAANNSNGIEKYYELTQKMSNTSPSRDIISNKSEKKVTVDVSQSRASKKSLSQSILPSGETDRLSQSKQNSYDLKLSDDIISGQGSKQKTSNRASNADQITIDLTDSPLKGMPPNKPGPQEICEPTSSSTVKSIFDPSEESFLSDSHPKHSVSSREEISTAKSHVYPSSSTKSNTVTSICSSAKVPILAKSESVSTAEENYDPIIAKQTNTPSDIQWSVHKQCLLVRTIKGNKQDAEPRKKVAGFDLDQTLVQWRCSGWPSRPEHYELWSNSVIPTLQKLHDEGYKLVIFSNQGGIRGAFQGKNATRVKMIIDWIASLVDRHLFAICSTKKDGGYHKGNSGMWKVMEETCNGGVKVQPESSFFTGDADGTGENARDQKQHEYQAEGVDKAFAENVGMAFTTPDKFFGKSNADRRKIISTIGVPSILPKNVIATRAALLGGYLSAPVLLITVGVQGSGKTTLSKYLSEGGSYSWCHYSQDTISNGKPGKREAVEAAVMSALREGKNVVVDRMNLDKDQRAHFVRIGNHCNVPVHALVLVASKQDIERRVTNRTNHPGKVEGIQGARIAVSSIDKLTVPTYDEGFDLISYTSETCGLISSAYRDVSNGSLDNSNTHNVSREVQLFNNERTSLPSVTFGSMGIGKKDTGPAVSRAIQLGIQCFDTAPTYKNETEVGNALANSSSIKVIIKVPKRVISASEARTEVHNSLRLLGRDFADIVLLHWPSDLIEAGSLQSVWKEMETMMSSGLCRTIGVCNFSVTALSQLLLSCEVKPAVNQIERHPLLPQYDLLEYCNSQGICLQAHSPLGHGNKLLMEHDVILQVSKESKLSAAQVLVLWNIQQGVPVVTKFSSDVHAQDIKLILQSKTAILTPKLMKALDNIYLSMTEETRFIAPPFMFKPGTVYSWGDKSVVVMCL